MPTKICKHKGCVRPAIEGSIYCKKHFGEPEQPVWEFKRSEVNYVDSRWMELSRELRYNHPYCDKCGLMFEPKDLIVHHKDVKAKELIGTEEFYNVDGLQVLCRKCHLGTIKRGE